MVTTEKEELMKSHDRHMLPGISRIPAALGTLASLLVLTLGLVACSDVGPQQAEADPHESGEDGGGFLQEVFGAPEPVTVPAGALLPLEFRTPLSTETTSVGESFETVLVQDVAVGGSVAIPVGSKVLGTVTESRGPKKIGGRARLSLRFETLVLDSGERVPISAHFAQTGKSETPKDAAIIGGSTLGGAILGEAIDEGEGTVVGGVVGAIAGVAGAIKTRGKPLTVPAGTVMAIELTQPVTVEVE